MTLAEFLRARLDEDETNVRRLSGPVRLAGSESRTGSQRTIIWEYVYDPARVLREVEAMRRIVETHRGEAWKKRVGCMECGGMDPSWDFAPADWPCPTLRALASIWSDHEDFNPAWNAESAPAQP